MQEVVKKIDINSEYYFTEGCYITELSNVAEEPEISIARARVEPGVTTKWHRLLEVSERYVILEGQGKVEIGVLPPQTVGAGDVILIKPGCRQRISNTGEGDLIFLAICMPRFVADCYESLGSSD